MDGEGHYSVIREITNESVYLTDPSKRNIEMNSKHSVFGGFDLWPGKYVSSGNQKSTIFDSVQTLKTFGFQRYTFLWRIICWNLLSRGLFYLLGRF